MCFAYVCANAYRCICVMGAGDCREISSFSDITSVRLCFAAALVSADVGHSAAVFLIGPRTFSLPSVCLLSLQRRRPVMYF